MTTFQLGFGGVVLDGWGGLHAFAVDGLPGADMTVRPVRFTGPDRPARGGEIRHGRPLPSKPPMRRAHRLRHPHAAGVFGLVAALAIAAATIPVTAALAGGARPPATTVDAGAASRAPRPQDPAALVRAAAWRAETSAARITAPLDLRLATPPAWVPALLLVAGFLLTWSRTGTARHLVGRLPGRRAPPIASA